MGPEICVGARRVLYAMANFEAQIPGVALRMRQIAAHALVSVSTAHHHMETLEDAGYVEPHRFRPRSWTLTAQGRAEAEERFPEARGG